MSETTTGRTWRALPAGVEDETGKVIVFGVSAELARRIAAVPTLEVQRAQLLALVVAAKPLIQAWEPLDEQSPQFRQMVKGWLARAALAGTVEPGT